MSEIKRVKIDSILENQIPDFMSEESPLFVEFLRQYYRSLESKSGAIDIAVNLNQYKGIQSFNNETLVKNTTLTEEVLTYDDEILVASTTGWPDSYGLLKIDNEIITYLGKTATSFTGCIRGFSGIDEIEAVDNRTFLSFTETEADEHADGSTVQNLSNLFLLSFFEKFKFEFFPGFENRDFFENISIDNVLSSARDFYNAKGTDSSYKLLFKILYGTEVEVRKPQDFTLSPSDNEYFKTENVLVELITPNPDILSIRGGFLFQDLPDVGEVGASIFNIEYRPVNRKDFFEISLDQDSFTGNFQVSGQTKLVEDVSVGSNTLFVDSTIGFAPSGKISIKPPNSNFITLEYTSKSTTTLNGVTGLTTSLERGLEILEEKFAYSFVGTGNTSRVDFRIVNVIKDVDFSKTSALAVGDKVQLSGFGENLFDKPQFNCWISNVPSVHTVDSVSRQGVNVYRLITFDEVIYYKREAVVLTNDLGQISGATVLDVEFEVGDLLRKYTNSVLIQIDDATFDFDRTIKLEKKLFKFKQLLNYFNNNEEFPAGIQNTYLDSSRENFYVTSTGVPNKTIFSTDDKKTVTTSGTTGITSVFDSPQHEYVSGDLVFYDPVDSEVSGIATGKYRVFKINENSIKLAFSNSDVFNEKFIFANRGITADEVVKADYFGKKIENQKLVKTFPYSKVQKKSEDINDKTTDSKPVGLLVNGTEILSPTLFDENYYYGRIEEIIVTNSGSDYDVLDPPPVEVKDEFGSGCKAHANLSGGLTRVKIISPGVGYQSKPKIKISGGNGSGAVLESNLVSSRISVGFKGDTGVSVADNTLTTIDDVLFVNGEEVIYSTNNNTDVLGIVNGSSYFVGIVTDKKVKLYNNKQDAVAGNNEIQITGISSGFHALESLKNKNTITEIYVNDPGDGYSNRAIKVPSVVSSDNRTLGVNTFDSYIYATNHGFQNSEFVVYEYTDTEISGLDTSKYYQVTKIDDNKFRLSDAGTASSTTDYNYINRKYVKFESLGVGTHTIKYPPITISIESTSELESIPVITPVVKPIVLGQIDDVFVEDGGVGYGVTDIINFHRRPNVGVGSILSNAVLKPIIINGSITDVKIINRGKGYRVDSDIIVQGSGDFAQLDPVVDSEGKLQSINIVNGGIGYASSTTFLSIQNRGINAKFIANVKRWKVNQVIKKKNTISPDDDGVLYPSFNPNFGLQFFTFYPSKVLRFETQDNFNILNKEATTNLQHSPILGFAYDGNPIYGPYGYDKPEGGPIRRMTSSYTNNPTVNPQLRPPQQQGYFTNDYLYDGSGDLDEHNGRFCVTPQFPDGTYAYFYTVSVDQSQISTPVYPYLVGPSFYDNPIANNFLPIYNQDDESIFNTDLVRNVSNYYLTNPNSDYPYIDRVGESFKQEFRVTDIQTSSIENAIVFTAGKNYKIDDIVQIDNGNSGGGGASVSVSELGGKDIESVGVTETEINNVEFRIRSTEIEAICSQPHNIEDLEDVFISGVSTITARAINGVKEARVKSKSTELLEDILDAGATGVSTFIKVKDTSGFKSNDFISVDGETLLITGVSSQRSGFYVNRVNNTGIHTIGDGLVALLPNRFSFKIVGEIDDYTFENTTTFFDPKETVGTGVAGTTRTVVGFGTTSFENRFIPTRSIYIPNHNFFTGEKVIYNVGASGAPLYVNNVGVAQSFGLTNGQELYTVNLGLNYIGLSTVGFTTNSSDGIGTTKNSLEFWPFDDQFGIVGAAHSITKTNTRITGDVFRNIGIITTKAAHGLQIGDDFRLKFTGTTTDSYKIKLDTINRKVLVDDISFADSKVDLTTNSIDISGYSKYKKLKTGDKVVYYAATPITGLYNGKTYYILKDSTDKIKLCEFEADINTTSAVDLTAVGSGTAHMFHLINPPLDFFRGTVIEFDVSDTTLAQLDMVFSKDVNLTKRLDLLGTDADGFAIDRDGQPGTADAKISVDTRSKFVPDSFFYTLVPKGAAEQYKKEISSDDSIVSANKITVKPHGLNDEFSVVGLSTDNDKRLTFVVRNPLNIVEKSIIGNSTYEYTTTSQNVTGPISKVRINFAGRGYTKLPTVSSIVSAAGTDGVVRFESSTIGRVESLERIKDGFDYPTDPTLTPTLSVPTVAGIKNIRTIDRVAISTGGNNYSNAPELVVPAKPTIKLIAVTQFGSVVDVIVDKNDTALADPLTIISTRNSNGFDIDEVTHSNDVVTFELNNDPEVNPFITLGYGQTGYTFPFAIGDEVFVENCRLTKDSRIAGENNFNSIQYDYAFYPVTGVSTLNQTVTCDLTGISTGTLGDYDGEITQGTIINKKDMPVFNMVLSDDVRYQSGEKVTAQNFTGNVMENGWDNDVNQLRINNSIGNLFVNDKLRGENSKIIGTVDYFNTFTLKANLGVSRTKTQVADMSSGILNDYLQSISDNYYFQKFSYELKSTIPYSTWKESVKSIVHPSGFKEFSNYNIETQPTLAEVNSGIAKSTSMKVTLADTTPLLSVNVDSEMSFFDKTNFGLVYEDEPLADGSVKKVFFPEGVELQPYIINRTNKVLAVDDISSQFDGTVTQQLRGRYADAADLLGLNRDFIAEEVVAKVEYNYVNVGLNTVYDRSKLLSETGKLVDSVAHDLKYNSNNETVDFGLEYWSQGGPTGFARTESLYGYHYFKFLGQYVINNQTPPTLYQSGTLQRFNFEVIDDPANFYLNRNKDSRDLIVFNKEEILDKSLASVSKAYPNFYFPGSPQTEAKSRYLRSYGMIQNNRQEIIDEAWDETVLIYNSISDKEDKYKREMGKLVDAVSIDTFLGGNTYTRDFSGFYFDGAGNPITDPERTFVGEEAQTIYAFSQARIFMEKAVSNQLTIKDLTAPVGPSTFGSGGPNVAITSTAACADVQQTLTTLTQITVDVISAGSTIGLPTANVGTYTTGGLKCRRDLQYIVDGVAQDISYDTNQHTVRNTKFYFKPDGSQKLDGLIGEEDESIYIFESSADYMQLAITNNLNYKDLRIPIDPVTGVNTDPSNYADIQTDIDTLVGILTVAIGNSSLAGIPTVGFGTADCADVRFSLANYVGIATGIIGFGTAVAPEKYFPSKTRGGIAVGLSTFRLQNNNTSLFKHVFSEGAFDIANNIINISNHNFQTGQELLFVKENGDDVGIGTTSFVEDATLDVVMNISDTFGGTAVLENGYNIAISGTISGISTTSVVDADSTTQFVQCIGSNGGTGTDAEFRVSINYDGSGVPISTSIQPTAGGSGYAVGDTITIAGTEMQASSPANDLTFVVTKTGPSAVATQANQSYSNVTAGTDPAGGTGAIFNVTRGSSGYISEVAVVNGGSGYASTSVITIAQAGIGGTDSTDDITVTPTLLGTKTMPSTVYCFKVTDNQIKLFGLSTTATFIDVTDVGVGTYSVEYKDPNASAIITIDGIIQTPLRFKSLSVDLKNSIGSANTTIVKLATGVSSIRTNDVLNIGAEYALIKSIGVGATNEVVLERGSFGTPAAAHTVGAAVTVLTGDFNIVGDVIHFSSPPFGKIGPAGLQTGSIFGGRVFSRTFDAAKPEDKNLLFDDLSLAFTGVAATEFAIKSQNQTTTTIFNDVNSAVDINNNPIVLINNVPQDPIVDYTVDGPSVNTLKFLSGVPKAGKISKVEITNSFGYEPKIGAAATVTIDDFGQIDTITINEGGTGYQSAPDVSIASTIGYGATITATVSAAGTVNGLTIVNAGTGFTGTSLPEIRIGVPTGYSNLTAEYTGGTSGDGQDARLSVVVGQGSSVVDFKIDNPGIGYKVGDVIKASGLIEGSGFRTDSLSITNLVYDETTGFTTITTGSAHNLSVLDNVRITGVGLTCGYDEVGIKSFTYDNVTGICTVTTWDPHGVLTSDVERRLTPSTATYCPHTGFTTLTVYGHSLEEGDFIRLEDNSLTFTCALDGHATQHTYPRSTDPAAGKFLEITDITGDEVTINVGAGGTDTSAHTFVSADPNAITVKGIKSNKTADEVYLHNVKFICTEEHAGVTTDIFPDGTAPYGFVFPAISSPGVTTFTMQAGVSTIPHVFAGYTELGISTFNYSQNSGVCVIETHDAHHLVANEWVTLADLKLKCTDANYDNYAGITSTLFPYRAGVNTYGDSYPASSPSGFSFKVTQVDDANTFRVNAGISTIVHAYEGFGAIPLYGFDYTESVGITTITLTEDHDLSVGEWVNLKDIILNCPAHATGITTYNVTALDYNEVAGIVTITTNAAHGQTVDDYVRLADIFLTCTAEHAGFSSTKFPYPAGTDDYGDAYPASSPNALSGTYDTFKLMAGTTGSTMVINIGVSTIPHSYDTGGTASVGFTTNKFPYEGSSPHGSTFKVDAVGSTTSFTFNAGISTIAHDYVSGGTAQRVGMTQKVPSVQRVLRYTEDSTDGALDFLVTKVNSSTQYTVRAGVNTIPHFYTANTGVTTFRQFEEFQLKITEVQTDKFFGFYPGQFIAFNSIEDQFNGFKKKFTLSANIDGVKKILSLRVPDGSDLDVTNNIFIYLNDVLQVPGVAYEFRGSRIFFTEAPLAGSSCSILYYRGSSADVEEIDPPKTIKVGDQIQINESRLDAYDIDQFNRTVQKIVATDQLETFVYGSIGIDTNTDKRRPLTWRKQKNDKIITGSLFPKSRPQYTSVIRPSATIINEIQPGDTTIYVDNAYPVFTDLDNLNENVRDILIIEDKETESAVAVANVSTSSSITSIGVSSGGVGYANTLSPIVTISASAITRKDPIFNWEGGTISGITGITTYTIFNHIDKGTAQRRFVAVGNSSLFASSLDLETWSASEIVTGAGNTYHFNSVVSTGLGNTDHVVAVGQSAMIWKATASDTAVTSFERLPIFEQQSLAGFGVINTNLTTFTDTINDIIYEPLNDKYVAVGAGGSAFVATGIGSTCFFNRYTGILNNINAVAHSPQLGYFVGVCSGGKIINSSTAEIWSQNPTPTIRNLECIIWDGSNFIAAGENGTIVKSVTREQYVVVNNNIGASNIIVDLQYHDDLYVAITDSGKLFYSFDLAVWDERSTEQNNDLRTIFHDVGFSTDGAFIAAGAGATAIYATPITHRATAESSVLNGIVTSITVTDGGFGYSQSNIPSVMVQSDTYKFENIRSIKAEGDHGVIVGVNTFLAGTPGIGTTSPKIEFVLKSEQYDNGTLGVGYSALNDYGVTASQISKGDYFVITDSNVGIGTQLTGISTLSGGMANYPASVVGTAKSFLDGVYRADFVTPASAGIVTVTCHFVPSLGDNNNFVQVYARGEDFSGIGTNEFYGRYSWGKIYDYQNRALTTLNPVNFDSYRDNGLTGLSTSPKVFRTRGLLSP